MSLSRVRRGNDEGHHFFTSMYASGSSFTAPAILGGSTNGNVQTDKDLILLLFLRKKMDFFAIASHLAVNLSTMDAIFKKIGTFWVLLL